MVGRYAPGSTLTARVRDEAWTLGTAAGANRVTAISGTLAAVAFDATATAAVTASVTVLSPVEKSFTKATRYSSPAIAKDAAGQRALGEDRHLVERRQYTLPGVRPQAC